MYPKKQLDTELLAELNVLRLFSLESLQEGIKIHSNATPENRAAAKRLFNKGLISQIDGGYLTLRGKQVAEHLESIMHILRPH